MKSSSIFFQDSRSRSKETHGGRELLEGVRENGSVNWR